MTDAPELYRDRATLLVYCDCGRNVAFLTWPTRSRALLSYTKLRGPGGTLWADSGAWGANPKCPRCGRVFLLYLADLAPWIDAGPDAPRARLDFPTRTGTGVDSATS